MDDLEKPVVNEEEFASRSDKKIDRSCAFCLNPVPAEQVVTCNRCKRRAYCSNDCRILDWDRPNLEAPGQKGQGHKMWCGNMLYYRLYYYSPILGAAGRYRAFNGGVACGEEDLDWKVVPIEGKGLGVVALRHIPANSRIMADSCQTTPEGHPKTVDLMPANGSLLEKFEANIMRKNGERFLSLRAARINHSCESNAVICVDKFIAATTVVAKRDIKPGEEICINYVAFLGRTLSSRNYKLKLTWNIDCSVEDCLCKDERTAQTLAAFVILDSKCRRYYISESYHRAVELLPELFDFYEAITPAEFATELSLCYKAVQACVRDRARSYDKAYYYCVKANEIAAVCFHPESTIVFELVSLKSALKSMSSVDVEGSIISREL